MNSVTVLGKNQPPLGDSDFFSQSCHAQVYGVSILSRTHVIFFLTASQSCHASCNFFLMASQSCHALIPPKVSRALQSIKQSRRSASAQTQSTTRATSPPKWPAPPPLDALPSPVASSRRRTRARLPLLRPTSPRSWRCSILRALTMKLGAILSNPLRLASAWLTCTRTCEWRAKSSARRRPKLPPQSITRLRRLPRSRTGARVWSRSKPSAKKMRRRAFLCQCRRRECLCLFKSC